MQRLAKFDVTRQFVSRRSQLLAQVMFGALCGGAMIGFRSLFDIWAPTSGPFALVYPTVLLATLYGHWRAGVTALVLTFVWAWHGVLKPVGSLTFADPTDPARVLINGVCCLIVIIFAEIFRRAAHSTVDQISDAAERRLTLLAELEHRTKNNFALVASMLEIQKRQLADPLLHASLDDAAGRVRTFADAYSNLAMEQAEDRDVEIQPYLTLLLNRIQQAAFPQNVQLFSEIDNMTIRREVAVAIGLYLNEAVSNCLKYAFPDGRDGTVGVFFHVRDGGWRMSIEDDGVGEAAVEGLPGGLGSSLMAAFAKQADARHTLGAVAGGYRAELSREMVATV